MMEHLNVMYAADENYAPFLGTSVFSLLENNKDIEQITIYAVLDRVSDDNVGRLKNMVEEYGRELVIVDALIFNQKMEELGVPKYRGSYTTHFRKFFHLFLGEDVERFLYIDSDSVVTGSLKPLLELDMGDKCGAVVLDALSSTYKHYLGFGDDEIYFNAGVTLIDVNNWKASHLTEALIEHITTKRAKYCNPDQDLFNMILRGKTMVIPPEYNFMPVHRAYSDKAFQKNYGFEHYYSIEQIENARKNPVILHTYRFLGEFPWHVGNCHPDTPVFDEYLYKSPWKDYVKKKKELGTAFKIEKLLYKVLPRDMFLTVFRIYTNRSTYKTNLRLKAECEGK